MKISIPGHKLQAALQAQIERLKDKRDLFEAYMRQHTATHGSSPDSRRLCAQEVQAQMINMNMDMYLRKMHAAIDALDANEHYRISLSRYLSTYVTCPYDTLLIPEDPADEADIQSFKLN